MTSFPTVLTKTVIGLLAITQACSADWPNFRGANHDGISHETGLKTQWNTSLRPIWEREVGAAFSSFSVVGDRLYTCGLKDGKQVLYCLDANKGTVVWENAFEKEFRNEFGDGTRATPTVNDGRVYVLGANGRLLCADAKTGRSLWTAQFNAKPMWAYSGSILIEGNLAIASAGGSGGSLVAFKKDTGEKVWQTGKDPMGYATPYPFTLDGKRYIVGFMGNAAIIVEAKTGREAWRTEWKTDWEVNASSPIFHDGYLFLSSGYRTGAGVMRLTPSGDKLTAEPVWSSKVLLNKFQSCILHEGNLYTSDQKSLKCVDFMTGQRRWNVPRIKHGTFVLADQHLYLLTQGGKLQVAPVSEKEFNPTAKIELLTGKCWSVPVINDGKLYARNLTRIVAFDISK
jgi:outer membrane protein assembly factor BamB